MVVVSIRQIFHLNLKLSDTLLTKQDSTVHGSFYRVTPMHCRQAIPFTTFGYSFPWIAAVPYSWVTNRR